MARVYKKTNSPFWYADYVKEGLRVRESTGCTVKREAERELAKRVDTVFDTKLARVTELVNRRPGSKPLFGRYSEIFLADYRKRDVTAETVARTKGIIEDKLIPEFGALRIDRIEPEAVTAWLMRRYKVEGARYQTLIKEFGVLKTVLKHALIKKLIPSNTATLAELPTDRDESTRTFLTPEEFQSILKHCGEPERAVFELFFATGMRKSEAMRLTDENLIDGSLYLPKAITKTAQARKIPLNSDALAAIERLRAYRNSEHIIPRRGINYYYQTLRAAACAAGFDLNKRQIGLHCLRRSFATRLANDSRVAITVTQHLLGHASLQQTQSYVHDDEGAKARAVELLNL